MARLPNPGSDDGTWGTILNDFLGVEHTSDGTLKTNGSLAAKADDTAVVHLATTETITGSKTFTASPAVPTPADPTHAANKTYVDSVALAPATNVSDETTYGMTKAVGSSVRYAREDHAHGTAPLPSTATAEDQNLLAWAYDPVHAVSFTPTSSGALSLIRVIIRKPATVTNVLYAVVNAGTGVVSGQNFIGLYDNSGIRVAQTADQTTNMGSTGIMTAAWTTPYAAAAGIYRVAILTNASTSPNLARAGANPISGLASAGLATSTLRFATFGSGLTSLPTSFSPASMGPVANGLFWVGLS